jgi:hypothetical protein
VRHELHAHLLHRNRLCMSRRQLRERQKKLHARLAIMRQERDARITAQSEEEARARMLVAGRRCAAHAAAFGVSYCACSAEAKRLRAPGAASEGGERKAGAVTFPPPPPPSSVAPRSCCDAGCCDRYRREREAELAQKQAVQQAEEQKRGAQRRAEVLKFLQMVPAALLNCCLHISNHRARLLPRSAATTPVAALSSCLRWLTCTLRCQRALEAEASARGWGQRLRLSQSWRESQRWPRTTTVPAANCRRRSLSLPPPIRRCLLCHRPRLQREQW